MQVIKKIKGRKEKKKKNRPCRVIGASSFFISKQK